MHHSESAPMEVDVQGAGWTLGCQQDLNPHQCSSRQELASCGEDHLGRADDQAWLR